MRTYLSPLALRETGDQAYAPYIRVNDECMNKAKDNKKGVNRDRTRQRGLGCIFVADCKWGTVVYVRNL